MTAPQRPSGADDADEKEKPKNLQVRVDASYQKRIAALASALGYASVADLIKHLLDEQLNNAQNTFNTLKQKADADAAQKAAEEKKRLDDLAATALGTGTT